MKLLLMSGGAHPYEESTPIVETLLKEVGHDVILRDDAEALTDNTLQSADALVFNTRREGDLALNVEQQNGLKNYISSGKGFVCIHISGCIPDTRNEFGDITGGGWVTGESFHPPYGEFYVDVNNNDHKCAAGLQGFDTMDELYMNVNYRVDNDVFLSADYEGGFFGEDHPRRPGMEIAAGTFPLAWTRSYGSGRVFVTLLGHDGRSVDNPSFQKVVLNGVDWVTRCLDI